MIRFLSLLSLATLFSCSSSYDETLEQALIASENNRSELEKVLDKYEDPADSLKYQAARHLILEMTREKGLAYFSPRYETFTDVVYDSMEHVEIFSSEDTAVNRWIRSKTFGDIWNHYDKSMGPVSSFNHEYVYDLRTVTADFLIENIEYAFKAWDLPWSRDYSFETFKEHILPYRYGNEVLSPWRNYYWEYFQPVVDQLGDETDPYVAAVAINNYMKRDFWGNAELHDAPRGRQKPINLLKGLLAGHCEDQSGLGMSSMRAMGIATTELLVPNWGNRPVGHSFTAIYSQIDNKWTDFHAGDVNPGDNTTTGMPKAYLYENWEHGDENNKLAYYQNLRDVTDWFTNTVDLSFSGAIPNDLEYVYLCTFNNYLWIPIMWSKPENQQANFPNMGTGMVYLPAYYQGDQLIPFSNPITVDSSGIITEIKPLEQTQAITITRKYTTKEETIKARCQDMIGGRFQLASDPNFSDTRTIYTITNYDSYVPQKVSIPPATGRYVRYVFPEVERNFKDGPAHIAFHTKEGKVTGEYLSSEPVLDRYLDAIFDDNLLTYVSLLPIGEGAPEDLLDFLPFHGPTDNLWVGMDLGSSQTISSIAFCPRNDKNNVYPGFTYELKYWDEKWISLRTKTAKDYKLTFENVPKNALYWLSCLTEGNEERVFTIDEDGKQVWW